MTIAMMMSPDRLEQEHSMLNRLVVGLLNDGRQVIRVVPNMQTEETASYEKAVSLATRLSVPMPVSWLQRSARRESVTEALVKANTSIIAAFGKQALTVALDVAPALNIPVLSEIISMKEAKRTKSSSPIWRWFAATPSIARVVTDRVGQDRSALVPLGTTTGKQSSKDLSVSSLHRCIAILDGARHPKSTRAILTVLSKVPDVHIFLELSGKYQHRVWQYVQSLEMLDRVTSLRDMGRLRSLIIQSDLVILPARTMPVRTILLEAMRCKVPVVATQIEGFDMLIDEETALIAKDDWHQAIDRILTDTHLAERIGKAGSELISTHYASAAQIAAFDAAFTLI